MSRRMPEQSASHQAPLPWGGRTVSAAQCSSQPPLFGSAASQPAKTASSPWHDDPSPQVNAPSRSRSLQPSQMWAAPASTNPAGNGSAVLLRYRSMIKACSASDRIETRSAPSCRQWRRAAAHDPSGNGGPKLYSLSAKRATPRIQVGLDVRGWGPRCGLAVRLPNVGQVPLA